MRATGSGERVALVSGGSSGIGLAIARMLAEEGFSMTLVARRPEKLSSAVAEIAAAGVDVDGQTANVTSEAPIVAAVAAHRERFGRLDVLVNAAGIGIGDAVSDLQTKHIDLQIAVNLRATMLFYRECQNLLRAAGAEHQQALVVNLASIAGKRAARLVSVYSAAKAGVIAWTEAMNKELADAGVRSTAICPGLVDTAMTDWIKDVVPSDRMLRVEDVSEAVRFLLRTSANCVVPELMLVGPGDALSIEGQRAPE